MKRPPGSPVRLGGPVRPSHTERCGIIRTQTKPRRRYTRRPSRLGILLATPAVALLALFLIWPIGVSAMYSTTSASGFGDMEPVGFDNYARAFADAELYAAVGRNILFAAIVVVLSVGIGFLLAYALYLRVGGWRALQVVYMVPYIMPVVVTAIMWQFILEPETGLLNSVLRAAGLDGLAGPWLTAQSTALPTAALIQSWVLVPFAMLLLFGSMVSLPAEVLEAASLDGAGHLTRMVRVVLPMIRPTLILTIGVIALQLFRSFDLVYLLTKGGPIGSTTIATLFVFVQGFVNNEYGYANAVGIIIGLALVIVAVTPRIVQAVRRSRTGKATA